MPMDHMNSFQFDLSSRVWNVIFVIRRHVCEVCAKASFVSECEKWKETQRSLWTCVCAQVGDVSLAQWKWKGFTTLRHFEWMRLRMANDKYSGIYELCDDATTILWWNDKIHPCRQSSAAVHEYVVINFAGIEKKKKLSIESIWMYATVFGYRESIPLCIGTAQMRRASWLMMIELMSVAHRCTPSNA